MAFAYYVVFPLVFAFLTGTAPEGVTVATDISKYLDFILTLFFAFGMAFEVPIATIILVWMGITTPKNLARKRPYIIVAAFVIGMLYDNPKAPDYVADVQYGALGVCRARGFDLLIHPCDGQSPTLVEEILDLHQQATVDGVEPEIGGQDEQRHDAGDDFAHFLVQQRLTARDRHHRRAVHGEGHAVEGFGEPGSEFAHKVDVCRTHRDYTFTPMQQIAVDQALPEFCCITGL